MSRQMVVSPKTSLSAADALRLVFRDANGATLEKPSVTGVCPVEIVSVFRKMGWNWKIRFKFNFGFEGYISEVKIPNVPLIASCHIITIGN